MRIWTVQPPEVVEIIQRGPFIPDPQKITFPEFASAYEWIVKQMESRIGRPCLSGQYPIWGWYQYMDSKKKRPDLRRTGLGQKGKEEVLIELETDEVLLSDFGKWHFVLDGFYLPKNIDSNEFDEFYAEPEKQGIKDSHFEQLPEPWTSQIIASWDRIFDLNDSEPIQATFWSIQKSQIRSMQSFQCR